MKIELTNNLADQVQIPLGGTLRKNLPDPVQVRKGITRVYDFKREAPGAPLLCDVTHLGDIARFLSIREGFWPHGEEAEAEARDKYGWEEEVAPLSDLADGQPEIIDDIIGDDDDATEPTYTGEDDDDLVPPASAITTESPDVPDDKAAGEVWFDWGRSLVDNPEDKDALEAYARQNYGLELDKRRAPLTLLKDIAVKAREA